MWTQPWHKVGVKTKRHKTMTKWEYRQTRAIISPKCTQSSTHTKALACLFVSSIQNMKLKLINYSCLFSTCQSDVFNVLYFDFSCDLAILCRSMILFSPTHSLASFLNDIDQQSNGALTRWEENLFVQRRNSVDQKLPQQLPHAFHLCTSTCWSPPSPALFVCTEPTYLYMTPHCAQCGWWTSSHQSLKG